MLYQAVFETSNRVMYRPGRDLHVNALERRLIRRGA